MLGLTWSMCLGLRALVQVRGVAAYFQTLRWSFLGLIVV